MVPKALRDALGLKVIKRSLHTQHRQTAQGRALFWAAQYAHAFALDWPEMTKTLEELLASATGARRSDYEMVPTAHGYHVKSEGEEDHRRALEMAAVLTGKQATVTQEAPPKSRKTVSAVKAPTMLSKALPDWLDHLRVGDPLVTTLGQKELREGLNNSLDVGDNSASRLE
jgi:hypothetical protein